MPWPVLVTHRDHCILLPDQLRTPPYHTSRWEVRALNLGSLLYVYVHYYSLTGVTRHENLGRAVLVLPTHAQAAPIAVRVSPARPWSCRAGPCRPWAAHFLFFFLLNNFLVGLHLDLGSWPNPILYFLPLLGLIPCFCLSIRLHRVCARLRPFWESLLVHEFFRPFEKLLGFYLTTRFFVLD